jgi:aspartate kinase
MLKVFKFGGASIKHAEAVRKLASLLNDYNSCPLIVVVSAMGKSTNALEALLKTVRNGDHAEYLRLFENLKSYHLQIAGELFTENESNVIDVLQTLFADLDSQFLKYKHDDYDFHYDQTVCFGELLSTTIINAFLHKSGVKNRFVDARDYIITDQHHRFANVDWETSCAKIRNLALDHKDVILTQGFIASTNAGITTTLGREGSDFSASIFAYCLDADEVIIWKDVSGLLNADPKRFADTVQLEHISYAEAIELAYYGASIIHPKTIKPLQNKLIPLKVQSFVHPFAPPSLITQFADNDASIPSYIIKDNQMLLSITPRDFSFMNENNLHKLFGIMSRIDIHANLIQTSAISLSLCVDHDQNKRNELFAALKDEYSLKFNTGLQLLTIRHYNNTIVEQMTGKNMVLVEQRSRTTVQLVLKSKALQ